MCGILGFSGRFDINQLKNGIEVLTHRGPDSSGIFFDETQKVGFAHSRLAIQDTSPLGDQPMTSCDGNVVIVFNGEIYNFKELREELIKKGYQFKGFSDTEVLVQLYVSEGQAMLSRLNGVFAFALWDRKENAILIARDVFGVKPLYFSECKRGFSFASEIKSLVSLGDHRYELDKISLSRYLSFLWCPGEGTPFTSVKKVLPGEALKIVNGEITNRWSWYSPPTMRVGRAELGKKASICGVQEKLKLAVERQLVSDVPVGAFLSGGLDSSAVVTFAKETIPNIQCFTIELTGNREGGVIDDLPFAKRVASHLNVPLEIVKVGANDMASAVEDMVYHLDEPLADPAALNVFFICQTAKQLGIKVLLSGTGGDDLFTGYRRHRAIQMEKYWSWFPEPIRLKIQKISAGMDKRKPWTRRFSKALAGAGMEANDRLTNYFVWSQREDLEQLLSPEFRKSIENVRINEPLIEFINQLPSYFTPLQRMLALEQNFFLGDHNLIYTDKMSMAAGVEVRVPFLDVELVQFASQIPDCFKQRGQEGKWVLKKAMEPYLPHEVIYRPKTGFGAPLRQWIRNDLRELIGDVLSETKLKRRGLFNYLAVQKLIAANDKGEVDGSYTIFSLLCIELWCQRFMKNH